MYINIYTWVCWQIALVYNTDYGTGRYYPQNLLLITINLALVLSFYLQVQKHLLC
jgi:hypothetical protein